MSPVRFNHTILTARDKQAAARWFADVFGLGEPIAGESFFYAVKLADDVVLLFSEEEGEPQHYAFHVSEDEFDEILARVEGRGLEHWADPGCTQPGINTSHGDRRTYFLHPDGHLLEALTRPYEGIP